MILTSQSSYQYIWQHYVLNNKQPPQHLQKCDPIKHHEDFWWNNHDNQLVGTWKSHPSRWIQPAEYVKIILLHCWSKVNRECSEHKRTNETGQSPLLGYRQTLSTLCPSLLSWSILLLACTYGLYLKSQKQLRKNICQKRIYKAV